MKKIAAKNICTITCTKEEEGISIEEKCRKMVETNEPITDGAPMIYTERDDGVTPSADIRTDRWEVAQSAMDKVNKTNIAKRKEASKKSEPNNNGEQKDTQA